MLNRMAHFMARMSQTFNTRRTRSHDTAAGYRERGRFGLRVKCSPARSAKRRLYYLLHKDLTMQTKQLTTALLLLGSCLAAMAADTNRAEKPLATDIKTGGYFEFTESSGSMGSCKRWTIKSTNTDGMLVIQCKDLLIYQSLGCREKTTPRRA